MKKNTPIYLLIVICLLRLLFLGNHDLVDPTETRYAYIGLHMFSTGDWLTPMLPQAEGIIPYLGKPPLHFWLSALSYTIFGPSAWSARIPSFIDFLLILSAIYFFCIKFISKESAISSMLVAVSAGLLFFLAGASVTDTTLTSTVTLAIYFLYEALENNTKKSFYIAAIFSALAFLTKGPIGIVLIALPFFLFMCVKKDFTNIKKIPFIPCILIFSVITLPWFILSEIKNPGFIKYFIWNENIGRYLFKDYGDKYGSGHIHTRGSSWWMLLLGFLPWTLFVLRAVFHKGFLSAILADNRKLFIWCWAISTPLFFTFVRQLHAMYLLPAIPAFSIIASIYWLETEKYWEENFKQFFSLKTIVLSSLAFIILIIVGSFFTWSLSAAFIATLVSILSIWFISRDTSDDGELESIKALSKISAFFVTLYLLVVISFGNYIDIKRSSNETLQNFITKAQASEELPLQVGIFTFNTYSPYWLEETVNRSAIKNNEKEKIKIIPVKPDKLVSSNNIKFVLVKSKLFEDIDPRITNIYGEYFKQGAWWVLKRKF